MADGSARSPPSGAGRRGRCLLQGRPAALRGAEGAAALAVSAGGSGAAEERVRVLARLRAPAAAAGRPLGRRDESRCPVSFWAVCCVREPVVWREPVDASRSLRYNQSQVRILEVPGMNWP